MLNEQFSDRYKVINVLDEGGFTRTYLARDHEQHDYPLCIIKCVNETRQPEEIQQACWMLANEARILRKLEKRTTNIPRLLASPNRSDHPYFVGEYIEGEVVEALRHTNRSLSQSELVAFLHHALSILDVVHRHNIVHQDIKPSNMIRRSDGTVSLIDFGAAIQIDEDPDPEFVFGTHGYSPPEQQNGEVSFANDLYALGISAIELSANIDPEQIVRFQDGRIDWQALNVRLDPPIVAILDKLVHRDSQERYSEALSVLSDLQRVEIRNRIVNRKPTERITRPIKRLAKQVRIPRIPALPIPPKVGIVASITVISFISGFVIMPLAPRISDSIAGQISNLRREHILTLARMHDISDQTVEQMAITTNQQLITVGNRQIQRWNLMSGKLEQSWTTEPISTIALSRDGQRLAGKTRSGELTIWAVSTGALIKRFAPPDQVTSMSISADGKYLATISTTKTMRVWNTDTGNLIRTSDTPIAAAAYSSTNQLVCATEDYRIGIWSSNEELQRMFFGHTKSVRALAISPDSNWLYSSGEDGTIVWQLDTGELVRVLPVRSDSTMSAGLIANQFVAQDQDGAMHLWNHSGRLVRSLGDFDTPVTYSPNGKHIAVFTKNRHLQIWQVKGN